ncbi:hypothetical protein CFC21_103674 [Triticum aestivum]|uniref:F-box domain-containing protein n=2 Tax=Triticum aestivum TaxID=4565 RepID=A0A9R1M8Y4_WHEAT|nr:uncharacterized protein LOC123159643 [Triticum aestivum]KAF7102558.1 hypothetical protein CFC21_103674 [Triticum aestivum]
MPPPWQPSTYAAGTIVAASPCRSSSPAGFHASPYSDPLSSVSDEEKTIGDTSSAAPPISLDDEFPKATAMGPYASAGWSDLPIDLLIRILHLLELPEALAFHAVCPSWRSASVAAGGVPPRRTPWLVSLAEEPLPAGDQQRPVRRGLWDPTATSELRNLVDAEKTFQVSFPWGQAVACCGASHGWLIMANELSDLVLYNPFTTASLSLPPITGFASCIEGVYGDEGNVVGYRYSCYESDSVYDVRSLGGFFYDKVVLSGSPSAGPAIALSMHMDGKRLSFARVGDSSWRQVSVIRRSLDSYADCVYHRGRFYVVTMEGKLKSWGLSGPEDRPRKKTIIAEGDDYFFELITRYLVSTPWGHLLQIRVVLDKYQEHYVRVDVDRLDLKSSQMVGVSPAKALRGHAAFLGQNSRGILSVDKFPEVRPDCIYFTTPRLRGDAFEHRHNQWSGVKVYDLRSRKLEDAFLSGGGHYGTICPSEVWFTPSL